METNAMPCFVIQSLLLEMIYFAVNNGTKILDKLSNKNTKSIHM